MLPTKFRLFDLTISEENFFRNQPIRNKNCLWRPYLLTDSNKMSILYRRPSIDASFQVSVHLAEWFQRRRLKCEKLRRRTPIDGKSSHCVRQDELIKKKTYKQTIVDIAAGNIYISPDEKVACYLFSQHNLS